MQRLQCGSLQPVPDEGDDPRLLAFGEGLRRVRESRKVSRVKLARLADVGTTTLATVEGGANVSVAVLLRISDALGIASLTALVAEIEGSSVDENAERLAAELLTDAAKRAKKRLMK